MDHTTTESVQTLVTCDVLVVGGGPAGSTISTLLAEQGWNVHILEKDSHPRFHIGESLLPQSLPILKQLGVLPEVEKIGIIKDISAAAVGIAMLAWLVVLGFEVEEILHAMF